MKASRQGGEARQAKTMSYALFDGNDRRIGEVFPTEKDVWMRAITTGLVSDVPVADEAGGQVLPLGYHVKQVPPGTDAGTEK
jgi:hypothetical protein